MTNTRENLRGRLAEARLYVVLGRQATAGRPLDGVVKQALEGGADIIQLREKSLPEGDGASIGEMISFGIEAYVLRKMTREAGALFIVNDRPDLVGALEADGVHLGQEDMPVAKARGILGPDKIIGVSTHSPEQAQKALADGADYIGVGPVYPTPTKAGRAAVGLDYVRQVAALGLPIPWFAIGGIDAANLPGVVGAGAGRAAVVRAVMGAPDPRLAASELKQLLQKHPL